jgi:hypothetical protein
VALQSLASIAIRSVDHMVAVIKLTMPKLISLLKLQVSQGENMNPDDRVVEHCYLMVVRFAQFLFSRKLWPSGCGTSIPELLSVTVDVIKLGLPGNTLYFHAISLIYCITACQDATYQTQIKANPSALRLLVASLQSKFFFLRLQALSTLLQLHHGISEPGLLKVTAKEYNIAFKRWENLPSRIELLLEDNSDVGRECKGMLMCGKACMQVCEDKDIIAFGKALRPLVAGLEYSIIDYDFSGHGLPFTRNRDALLHCAEAARNRGTPDDLDLADMLELRWSSVESSIDETHKRANEAIRRNPDEPFFYYIAHYGVQRAEGLPFLKKGLTCSSLTDFLRQSFLATAVEHAYHIGSTILGKARSKRKVEEGVAFYESALRDSVRYMETAAIDATRTKNVILLHVLLSLSLEGPSFSNDLRELKAS